MLLQSGVLRHRPTCLQRNTHHCAGCVKLCRRGFQNPAQEPGFGLRFENKRCSIGNTRVALKTAVRAASASAEGVDPTHDADVFFKAESDLHPFIGPVTLLNTPGKWISHVWSLFVACDYELPTSMQAPCSKQHLPCPLLPACNPVI